MPRDDDDREKLSWREIDQMRNRSRHTSGDRPSVREHGKKADWVRKQALKEAEKFFQGKKGTAPYKEAHRKLHDQYGTPEFAEAARAFVEQFGMPDEWGTLQLFLDLPNAKLVLDAVQVMKTMLPKRTLLEQKGFKTKMKVLASSGDQTLRRECGKILEEL